MYYLLHFEQVTGIIHSVHGLSCADIQHRVRADDPGYQGYSQRVKGRAVLRPGPAAKERRLSDSLPVRQECSC